MTVLRWSHWDLQFGPFYCQCLSMEIAWQCAWRYTPVSNGCGWNSRIHSFEGVSTYFCVYNVWFIKEKEKHFSYYWCSQYSRGQIFISTKFVASLSLDIFVRCYYGILKYNYKHFISIKAFIDNYRKLMQRVNICSVDPSFSSPLQSALACCQLTSGPHPDWWQPIVA